MSVVDGRPFMALDLACTSSRMVTFSPLLALHTELLGMFQVLFGPVPICDLAFAPALVGYQYHV